MLLSVSLCIYLTNGFFDVNLYGVAAQIYIKNNFKIDS